MTVGELRMTSKPLIVCGTDIHQILPSKAVCFGEQMLGYLSPQPRVNIMPIPWIISKLKPHNVINGGVF